MQPQRGLHEEAGRIDHHDFSARCREIRRGGVFSRNRGGNETGAVEPRTIRRQGEVAHRGRQRQRAGGRGILRIEPQQRATAFQRQPAVSACGIKNEAKGA